MNKRIKELAEQAEWRFADKATGNFSEYDRRLEKFAELIVEEMYCFMCDATDNDKPWPSFNDVKKHFGVEE